MKKRRQVHGISKGGAISRAAAYCALYAIILCSGCSDNTIGSAIGERKEPDAPMDVNATVASSTGITVS